MMGTVLFTSNNSLERAENLRAVYEAYDGDKEFLHTIPYIKQPDFSSGRYVLRVADELPGASPGKCIFIGHGMGAGKTYGLQQPDPYFSRPDLITYAIASSTDMVPVVAGYCGIPEDRVIPLGMPRTDAYFESNVAKDDPYTYHLYAPTFRKGSWKPNFDELHWNMPEGHKLMVKPHMVTGRILRESVWDTIEEHSAYIPTTPFLLKAKTLITDYSSIMFDAMVLRRPTLLFARDRERYLKERGMFYPYPEMYSRYFFDREKDLAKALEYAKWDEPDEKLREFYVGACDGHSVERTIELIRSVL